VNQKLMNIKLTLAVSGLTYFIMFSTVSKKTATSTCRLCCLL